MTVQRRRHGKITSRLLNEEFGWNKDGLLSFDPILGPAVRIKREWIKKAISKMKSGRKLGHHAL